MTRFFTWLLILALSLQGTTPAWALRPVTQRESKSGLEELEREFRRVAGELGLPVASPPANDAGDYLSDGTVQLPPYVPLPPEAVGKSPQANGDYDPVPASGLEEIIRGFNRHAKISERAGHEVSYTGDGMVKFVDLPASDGSSSPRHERQLIFTALDGTQTMKDEAVVVSYYPDSRKLSVQRYAGQREGFILPGVDLAEVAYEPAAFPGRTERVLTIRVQSGAPVQVEEVRLSARPYAVGPFAAKGAARTPGDLLIRIEPELVTPTPVPLSVGDRVLNPTQGRKGWFWVVSLNPIGDIPAAQFVSTASVKRPGQFEFQIPRSELVSGVQILAASAGLEEKGDVLEKAHPGPVIHVAWSNRPFPENMILSVGQDGTVHRWEEQHGGTFYGYAAFTRNRTALVNPEDQTPHKFHGARGWKAPNLMTADFSSNGGAVFAAGIDVGRRFSTAFGQRIGHMDLSPELDLKGRGILPNSVALSFNRKLLAVGGSQAADVLVLNMAPEEAQRFESSNGIVKRIVPETSVWGAPDAVVFSPDGAQIAIGHRSGEITLASLGEDASSQAPAVVQTLRIQAGDNVRIQAVTFSPDGRFLAAGDQAGNIYVWKREGANHWEHGPHFSHGSSVQALEFAAEYRIDKKADTTTLVHLLGLASAGEGNEVRFWDPETGRSQGAVHLETEGITSPAVLALSFRRDGKKFVAGMRDGALHFRAVPAAGLEEDASVSVGGDETQRETPADPAAAALIRAELLYPGPDGTNQLPFRLLRHRWATHPRRDGMPPAAVVTAVMPLLPKEGNWTPERVETMLRRAESANLTVQPFVTGGDVSTLIEQVRGYLAEAQLTPQDVAEIARRNGAAQEIRQQMDHHEPTGGRLEMAILSVLGEIKKGSDDAQIQATLLERFPLNNAGLEEGFRLGPADLYMRGDILVDIVTGKRLFVVTRDQPSENERVSLQDLDDQGRPVTGPENPVPAQMDFKLRFRVVRRELVNTFNRHETRPGDRVSGPVTLAPPPGQRLLLQTAPVSEVPTETNSRFVLVQIPSAEKRAGGIQVLDQVGEQFQPEQFTAAGSQGLDGMRVPYKVRVTQPWSSGKKGSTVSIDGPESLVLKWDSKNGSLQIDNLPSGAVLLAHRFSSGLEEKYRIERPGYSGPITIVGKVGGTHFELGVGSAEGLLSGIGGINEPTLLRPGVETQDQILQRWALLIWTLVRRVGANRVMKVHLSAPGWFRPDGTLLRDQENIPGLKAELHMAHELESRLAQLAADQRSPALGQIEVKVVHDATAHANGETSRFGKFPDASKLFFIGPGTGIATRAVFSGQPFTGGERVQFMANEVPHSLIWNPATGSYDLKILEHGGDHPDFTNPALADGSANPLYGREDLEDRTAGPGIGRAIATAIRAGGSDANELLTALKADGHSDIAARIRDASPSVRLTDEEHKRVTETAARWAVAAQPNRLARRIFEERARELGSGLATLLVEFSRIWPDEFQPEGMPVVVGGGVSQVGDFYLKAVRQGFAQRYQAYAAEGRPVPELSVDQIHASDLEKDSDRELLAGLPSAGEVTEYAGRLETAPRLPLFSSGDQIPREEERITDRWPSSAAGLEELEAAQRAFHEVPAFFQPKAEATQRSAVVVDLSDPKNLPVLGNLAWALSIMRVRQQDHSPEFRVVMRAESASDLLRQWAVFDPTAAGATRILTDQIVLINPGERPQQVLERVQSDLNQKGFIPRLFSNSDITPRLALDLRAFFAEGGLNFVTDEAFDRLNGLLQAA